jgi:hypothetical protein
MKLSASQSILSAVSASTIPDTTKRYNIIKNGDVLSVVEEPTVNQSLYPLAGYPGQTPAPANATTVDIPDATVCTAGQVFVNQYTGAVYVCTASGTTSGVTTLTGAATITNAAVFKLSTSLAAVPTSGTGIAGVYIVPLTNLLITVTGTGTATAVTLPQSIGSSITVGSYTYTATGFATAQSSSFIGNPAATIPGSGNDAGLIAKAYSYVVDTIKFPADSSGVYYVDMLFSRTVSSFTVIIEDIEYYFASNVTLYPRVQLLVADPAITSWSLSASNYVVSSGYTTSNNSYATQYNSFGCTAPALKRIDQTTPSADTFYLEHTFANTGKVLGDVICLNNKTGGTAVAAPFDVSRYGLHDGEGIRVYYDSHMARPGGVPNPIVGVRVFLSKSKYGQNHLVTDLSTYKIANAHIRVVEAGY